MSISHQQAYHFAAQALKCLQLVPNPNCKPIKLSCFKSLISNDNIKILLRWILGTFWTPVVVFEDCQNAVCYRKPKKGYLKVEDNLVIFLVSNNETISACLFNMRPAGQRFRPFVLVFDVEATKFVLKCCLTIMRLTTKPGNINIYIC